MKIPVEWTYILSCTVQCLVTFRSHALLEDMHTNNSSWICFVLRFSYANIKPCTSVCGIVVKVIMKVNPYQLCLATYMYMHLNSCMILYTSHSDMVKRLINKMDFEALEVKMKKCKVLFECMHGDNSYRLEHVCVCINYVSYSLPSLHVGTVLPTRRC